MPEGGRAKLTPAMADEGLDAVTALLDDATHGHHFAVKGIAALREKHGSHGVWGVQKNGRPKMVMLYKILHAAKRCELSVIVFDFGQKARCASMPSAARSRRRRSRPPTPPQRPSCGGG